MYHWSVKIHSQQGVKQNTLCAQGGFCMCGCLSLLACAARLPGGTASSMIVNTCTTHFLIYHLMHRSRPFFNLIWATQHGKTQLPSECDAQHSLGRSHLPQLFSGDQHLGQPLQLCSLLLHGVPDPVHLSANTGGTDNHTQTSFCIGKCPFRAHESAERETNNWKTNACKESAG